MKQIEKIALVEQLAANNWPAVVNQFMDDWILRATFGFSRRANSVLALHSFPNNPNWFQDVEAFYKRQGLPVIYEISNASPAGLDQLLDDHGYEFHLPCWVMEADLEEVLQKTSPVSYESQNVTTLPSDWLDAYLQFTEAEPSKVSFYQEMFQRISPVKAFGSILHDGKIAGVGTAVVERGWAGIGNVAVDPNLRRQGIGNSLLHSLASWSAEQGAKRLYLQVVQENEKAVRLYEKTGFRPLYSYHYRIKKL